MKIEKDYYFENKEANGIEGHICDILLGEIFSLPGVSLIKDKRFRIFKSSQEIKVKYNGLPLMIKVKNIPVTNGKTDGKIISVGLYGMDLSEPEEKLKSMKFYSTFFREFRDLKEYEKDYSNLGYVPPKDEGVPDHWN